MNYVAVKDWCDDCAWVATDAKWLHEIHRRPCPCICHHPSRITEALREIRAAQQPAVVEGA